MEQFKAPSPLSLTANPADNWCSWEQSFRRYIAASGEKDEQGKIDILIHTIGEDALEVLTTLTVRRERDELTMEDVLQAFKDYYNPQRNVVFERLQYWSHQRTAGTSVNTFITELRHKSKDCEFGISENDMIRDKLVFSITDSHLQKRLLQERCLTLHRAIEICSETEEKTLLQTIKTQHGVKEVPVDGEMKMILPDKSLHHNTSRQSGSQSVPNKDETEKLVLAAFMPKVQLHRLQLQVPPVTDCVFSERKNVEQLLPERLHIKEEPEMLSEGQEEKQLCVQQETNRAACCVKCEDEEEKPQTSQLHWRQLTEMNMKEEPSTCTLNEFMKRQTVGINSKGPESAQNPDPSSLVLQGPDGTETDSSLTEDGNEDDEDEDEDCWQKHLPESETVAETDFDSTRKKRNMCDSSKKAEMECEASKTWNSSFQQICSKTKVQVKITSECVAGKKTSLGAAFRGKPFKCDVCHKCFIQKHHLQTHIRIHTGGKPFKCDVCSKCFIQKPHLQSHIRIHTGEKPFKCDICSKCFAQKSDLHKHIKIHTGEKQFKCDVCSKCFIQKQQLQIHMTIHSGEKSFKCDLCSKYFKYKVCLNRHMRLHTGEKPFKCDLCTKCFIQKCDLDKHMRIHTGVKPFKCDVCCKFFTRKDNLLSHVRMHKEDKQLKCDVCSNCFKDKAHLKLHMRTHTGEKPFKCDFCGKCFKQRSDFNIHIRIHTGEKPFKCDVCSKCFIRKEQLKLHSRNHTGEKKFECDVCSKCFTRKENLQSHVRKHKEVEQFNCDT